MLGTSLLPSGGEADLGLVWRDLSVPAKFTYSRSRGKARRSLLERYDHEHDFRLLVARSALALTGTPADPSPPVEPIGKAECGECPYAEVCAEALGPDDASMALTISRPDIREWKALRRRGIRTVAELAALDPDDAEFFAAYHPEVAHRSAASARARLHDAVRQARMIRDDVAFSPKDAAAVSVPAADVEIDFDLEWDRDQRIYQWGLRVRADQDEATARYEPVVSFDPLDDDDAVTALARRAAARILELRTRALAQGRTVAVYHWHHVEQSKTRGYAEMAAALDGVVTDLRAWFTATFHVRGGSGIKRIAPLFGFAWSVEDPGGLVSMGMIDLARGGGAEAQRARQWCLDYNASDCAAQAAIRDGLRALYAPAPLS